MKHLSLILITILLTLTEALSLTATITNSNGNPLKNVKVTFSNADTTVYTDAEGKLDVEIMTPIIHVNTLSHSNHLTYNRGTINISLISDTPVEFSLYSLQGRQVMDLQKIFSGGTHQIKVPHLASGLYILRAKIGNEQFLQKFVSGSSFTLSGMKQPIYSRGLRDTGIDTVQFSFVGYYDVVKQIDSYDTDLGTIVMSSNQHIGDWYGLKSYSVDTTIPNFVHTVFRAYDEKGTGIASINASRFIIKENDEAVEPATEPIIEKTTDFNTSIYTVLLIDNSKSAENILKEVKDAAKAMVRTIAPNQKFAIYAFSDANVKFVDFNNDTTSLLTAIDAIPTGYNSTNLYGAIVDGFTRTIDTAFFINKKITYGNVVLFTTGKDTQGSKTLTQVLEAQNGTDFFTIGFGDESSLDLETLKQLSDTRLETTTQGNNLKELFIAVQQKITLNGKSFYHAYYRSPKRGDNNHTVSLEVTNNSNKGNDANISGTFNSAIFQAGWAPTAENLSISLNTTKDSLIGSYVYHDKDGDAEGKSEIYWFLKDEPVYYDSLNIPLASVYDVSKMYFVKDTLPLIFLVKPVSYLGASPQEGEWTSCSVSIAIPHEGYTYGDTNREFARAITSAKDGYIIAGHTVSYSQSANDFYVLKISIAGDTLWTRTYGGPRNDEARAITIADEGYIITGITYSYGAGEKDFYAIKINEDGDTLWSKTYGGDSYEDANSIIPANGGYIIAGGTSSFGAGVNDFWAVKINENGDTLWTKTYGGSQVDIAKSIEAAENGYIITGYTASFGSGSYDIYAVKINESGDTLWTRTYGGTDSDEANAITKANNGGYIIVGKTSSFGEGANDFYAVKINESGDTLWTKTYGSHRNERASAIVASKDGYIIAGSGQSLNSNDDDLWAIMIDENGNKIWRRLYGETSSECGNAIIKNRNRFIITGETISSDPENFDIWAINIDEQGLSHWFEDAEIIE